MTCYTYYGRIEDAKPKKGLHYFMIDEYLKDILNKCSSKFKKDLAELLVNLKKESESDVISMKRTLAVLSRSIKDLEKRLDNSDLFYKRNSFFDKKDDQK